MATHCSTLSGKFHGDRSLDRLQSMGNKDWVTEHTYIPSKILRSAFRKYLLAATQSMNQIEWQKWIHGYPFRNSSPSNKCLCVLQYILHLEHNRNSNTVFYTVPGDKLGERHSGHRTSKWNGCSGREEDSRQETMSNAVWWIIKLEMTKKLKFST